MGIKIQNLTCAFGSKTIFSSDTLLTENTGLVLLKGANGSGKTSLLRILSTLLSPASGAAWVNEESIHHSTHSIRNTIAYVPASDSGFFPRLSGMENLMLFGRMRGLSHHQVLERVLDAQKILALEDALNIPFLLSSNGMRQSLLLCRALLHQPKIILLDEPTRSLDAVASSRLRAAVFEISKTKLVIMSSHQEESGMSKTWIIEDQRLREDS